MKRHKQTKMNDEIITQLYSTYINYYNRIRAMAIASIKYKNLPLEIDPDYMEGIIFDKGQILYFREDEMNYDMVLPFTGTQFMSMNNIPYSRQAYSNHGYHAYRTYFDSVIIYANNTRTVDSILAANYAAQMAMVDTLIRINLNAQKTPYILVTDSTTKLTVERIWDELESFSPVITRDKALKLPIEVLNLNVPYLIDKLTVYKEYLWTVILTDFGINSVPMKKERMISDELIYNTGAVLIAREKRLRPRNYAIAQINKMFDRNITVEFTDFTAPIKTDNGIPEEGGQAEYEQIYN